jgi:hypothetical protein
MRAYSVLKRIMSKGKINQEVKDLPWSGADQTPDVVAVEFGLVMT